MNKKSHPIGWLFPHEANINLTLNSVSLFLQVAKIGIINQVVLIDWPFDQMLNFSKISTCDCILLIKSLSVLSND